MSAKRLILLGTVAFFSIQINAGALSLPNNPNLILNPSFSNLLLDWQVDDASSTAWVPNFGVPDSSGQVTGAVAIGGEGNSNTFISQCRPVAEGFTYKFSIAGLSFCDGGAVASARFSNETCTNELGIAGITVADTGHWLTSSTTVIAPAGAQTVVVELGHIGALNCDEAVYFDEIFFGDQIFSGGFE